MTSTNPALKPPTAPAAAEAARDAGFAEYLASPEVLQFLDPDVVRSPAPSVPVRTVTAEGRSAPVRIRIYGDGGAGSRPGLVWLHGGGFVSGDLDMPEADYVARVLAHAGTPVLSVDYRLAKDGVTFPLPHEDTLTAWFWARNNADSLGLDPNLLCLGGAGAGGNLAVGAALYLVDAGMPLPAKLLLAYPFVHAELPKPARTPDRKTMAGLPRRLRFTVEDCLRVAENFVGGPVNLASSYAMPGYADPAGLPPTALLACEYDDALGSCELFASELERAGVPVTFFLAEGAVRGHLHHSAGLPEVKPALDFLIRELPSVTAP